MTTPSRFPDAATDFTAARADGTHVPEHERVAPDGQQIVDQTLEVDEERAAIAEAARRQESLSRQERGREA